MESSKPSQKKLEVLVIEDNLENVETAKKAFEKERNYNFTYAGTYKDALSLIPKTNLVISDLMFPHDKNNTPSKNYDELVEKMIGILDDNKIYLSSLESNAIKRDLPKFLQSQEYPAGILIAEICKEKEIPYLIITSGHGAHGDSTTPVAMYMKITNLIKNYRGIETNCIKDTMELFGRIPSKKEFIKEMTKKKWGNTKEEAEEYFEEEIKEYFSTHFYTDADKKDPKVWDYALKIVSLQNE